MDIDHIPMLHFHYTQLRSAARSSMKLIPLLIYIIKYSSKLELLSFASSVAGRKSPLGLILGKQRGDPRKRWPCVVMKTVFKVRVRMRHDKWNIAMLQLLYILLFRENNNACPRQRTHLIYIFDSNIRDGFINPIPVDVISS
jgi:hypothetical protein